MSLDINLTGVEITSNKKTTLTDNSDTFYPTQKAVKTAVDLKVDIVAGKGLSANDFTNTLKTKLDGIQDGAEVNVNADWNATSGDAEILNKPTIPDPSDFVAKSDFTSHSILAKQSGGSDPVAVSIGNNEILGRKSGGGSDIEGLSVSEVKSLLNYTASDVGAVATNSAITGATKTKITYDAKGLVTSGADATTADIADSTNKRYVTDANLTLIGNTSGTNTGDETQSSILSKLGFFVSNRITESTAVTGTTAVTIIENVTIPANTYLNGGIMRIYNAKFRKVGTNGIFTVKMYIGPTANNLTGATQIGTFATTGGAPLYIEGLRTFTCTTSGILGFNATNSLTTDTAGQTSTARLSATIDWTVAQNVMFSVQLASASDSVTMIGNSIKNF